MPGSSSRRAAPLTASALVVLGFVQALWPLTMDLYLPSFPQIELHLRTSSDAVSLTLTGAFVGMAIGQLAAGPLSDRIGRMRPLVGVLAVYTLATVACAVAPSIEVLVASRVVQGLGSSAAAVITLAIVRDCAAGPRMVRLLARLQLVNGTFVVVSPALGAILLIAMDWRGLFWLLVAFGAALLITVALTVARHETLPKARRQTFAVRVLAADYRALAKDLGFVTALGANTLLWAGMMGYMASSSFLFQGIFGLDPTVYAVVFGAHGAVMILAAQASAALTDRFGLTRVTMFGTAAAGLSAASLIAAVTAARPNSLAAFLIPLFCFAGSFGVLSPCLQAGALERHGRRAGTAASVLGAASMIAGAVSAPVVASFGVDSTQPVSTFLASTTLAAVAVVVIGAAIRRRVLLR